MRSQFFKKSEDQLTVAYYHAMPSKDVIMKLSPKGVEYINYSANLENVDKLPFTKRADFNHQLNLYYVSQKFCMDIDGKTFITKTDPPEMNEIYETDTPVFHNGYQWTSSPVGGRWPKVVLSRKGSSGRDVYKYVDVKYIRLLVPKRS